MLKTKCFSRGLYILYTPHCKRLHPSRDILCNDRLFFAFSRTVQSGLRLQSVESTQVHVLCNRCNLARWVYTYFCAKSYKDTVHSISKCVEISNSKWIIYLGFKNDYSKVTELKNVKNKLRKKNLCGILISLKFWLRREINMANNSETWMC